MAESIQNPEHKKDEVKEMAEDAQQTSEVMAVSKEKAKEILGLKQMGSGLSKKEIRAAFNRKVSEVRKNLKEGHISQEKFEELQRGLEEARAFLASEVKPKKTPKKKESNLSETLTEQKTFPETIMPEPVPESEPLASEANEGSTQQDYTIIDDARRRSIEELRRQAQALFDETESGGVAAMREHIEKFQQKTEVQIPKAEQLTEIQVKFFNLIDHFVGKVTQYKKEFEDLGDRTPLSTEAAAYFSDKIAKTTKLRDENMLPVNRQFIQQWKVDALSSELIECEDRAKYYREKIKAVNTEVPLAVRREKAKEQHQKDNDFYQELHPRRDLREDAKQAAIDDAKEQGRYYENKQKYEQAFRDKIKTKVENEVMTSAFAKRWGSLDTNGQEAYGHNFEHFKAVFRQQLVDMRKYLDKHNIDMSNEAMFAFIDAGYEVENVKKAWFSDNFSITKNEVQTDKNGKQVLVRKSEKLDKERFGGWIERMDAYEKGIINKRVQQIVDDKYEMGRKRFQQYVGTEKKELIKGTFDARVYNAEDLSELYAILHQRGSIVGADGRRYTAVGVVRVLEKGKDGVVRGNKTVEEFKEALSKLNQLPQSLIVKSAQLLEKKVASTHSMKNKIEVSQNPKQVTLKPRPKPNGNTSKAEGKKESVA